MIDDAANDPRFVDHPGLKLHGIRAYAAVPLYDGEDNYFGTLCVLDPEESRDLARHVGVLSQFSNLISHQLKLEDAERDRALLIGMLAHDLRNPLQRLALQSEIALRDPNISDSTREVLQSSVRTVERMAGLTSDLLDFAQLRSSSQVEIRGEPVSLAELSHQVAGELARGNDPESIEIEIVGDPHITGDRGRLHQVLQNLIENALQHAPENSKVALRIDGSDPEELRFTVHNAGEPIPPELQVNLFKPFHRSTRPGLGRGLGLFIVSELVKAHRASLQVMSSAESGTTFVIDFPRRAPQDSIPAVTN